MNSFEKGRRRVPVSFLPVIAQALDATLEALIAHDAAPAIAPKKCGPQKKLRQETGMIEALRVAKLRLMAHTIDSVLAGQQLRRTTPWPVALQEAGTLAQKRPHQCDMSKTDVTLPASNAGSS